MNKRKCPRCGGIMDPAGAIRAGVRRGLKTVYICRKCGHRDI